jgi:hypothetical protein
VLGHDGAGGGPARFRRRPTTKCSEEGLGSKAVGCFGVVGRKSSPEERALQ